MIPRTQNPEWGYYGTLHQFAPERSPAVLDVLWTTAMTSIKRATGGEFEAIRRLLDSSQGRHFADDVENALRREQDCVTAIAGTVQRWMNWRIGRMTSHETGIPAGLPYLTGFVEHYRIEAENEELGDDPLGDWHGRNA